MTTSRQKELERSTDEIRVFVECYQCYNAGEIRGEWVTLEGDPDTDREEIDAVRERHLLIVDAGRVADPTGEHEEWGAFDHEGLPTGFGESLMLAVEYAEKVGELRDEWGDLPTRVLTEAIGDDMDPETDIYLGVYDSWSDLAEQRADDDYYGEDIGKVSRGEVEHFSSSYLDYEAMGRDLSFGSISEIDGHYFERMH